MDRVILHCDCNNYFASVELLERPDLRELPVAVAGDPEGRHGIILAKNQLAKKYGGEDDSAFVNGILGTIARSLPPETDAQ